MKKILCVNYSQSGQLDEILDRFTEPLKAFQLERVKIKPQPAYPFPWSAGNFYDGMPETVQETPMELQPFSFKETHYDLIILGYQPWFLSPSLPTSSLLKHPDFMERLKDTPVMTIIGARNMSLNAHDSVVNLVEAAGGHMVGNYALVDRAPNQLSAISIVHWMMTGKKTRKWGIFPLPGVSQEDIDGATTFGQLLVPYLEKGNYTGLQDQIIREGGLRIQTSILFIEGKAKKIFRIWAKLILKKEAQGKSRRFWIAFFRFYLNFALFIVAPILLLLYTLLMRPFLGTKIRAKKQRYSFLGIHRIQR
ncbi:MAG: hypothetical protein A3D92_07950 [Bacteroidetes bacterium RIFCSPHIGHO2_02_FULL_44_7]|nr:MAG: hypothetical protein A3D92_07950 [Bacteroidetes bacterium RIFCSPHIGHO2_02_FULL_44_7]